MDVLLICAVALLAFATGGNDNFKGVATLWGAGLGSYWQAITWATGFTFLGSITAIWLGSGLAAKFSGAELVGGAILKDPSFLIAVSAGTAATVLLAAKLGLPISTTHALTGALVGAGIATVGFSHMRFASLVGGVVLPLLFSPFVALLLTVGVRGIAARYIPSKEIPDCICADQPARIAVAGSPPVWVMSVATALLPSLRWAPARECQTGQELARFRIVDGLHWFSAAAISYARGLNDTPKIVA